MACGVVEHAAGRLDLRRRLGEECLQVFAAAFGEAERLTGATVAAHGAVLALH
jgi:hypothetical protein